LQFEISERVKCINYGQKFVYVPKSRRPFSKNLQLLNGITWRFPVSNFTHIGQEIWKVRAEIHLHPSSEVWLTLSRSAWVSSLFDTI